MTTFVLVHGAWHGAWCWHRVTPLLEREGHRAITPDLPGHGIDPTPLSDVTLQEQVQAVCRILDDQPEPVVLVGHSSGGAVITQAAEHRPDAVARLVYLAAFLPPDGTSVMDLAQSDPDSVVLRNLIVDEPAGHTTVDDGAVLEAFYHDCPEHDLHLARTLLRPEPLATIATPVTTTVDRFGTIPRTYITCTDDHAITTGTQARMQDVLPCDQTLTIPTGHSPFFADPSTLAAQLATAAA